jgi:hypothetical protein
MDQGYLTQYKLIPVLAEQGYKLSLPCDPMNEYDLLVDNREKIYRVQVKSCNVKKRNRYRADIAQGCGRNKRPYPDGSIDFFIIYVPIQNVWYVIPQRKVSGQKWVSLYPHDARGKYDEYRNSWSLLRG